MAATPTGRREWSNLDDTMWRIQTESAHGWRDGVTRHPAAGLSAALQYVPVRGGDVPLAVCPSEDGAAPGTNYPAGSYFEAPDYYTPRPGDGPVVFLGGGITGCPRWHHRAAESLIGSGRPLVVCNPNRRSFPIDDPSAGWEQVRWEQHHLHLPDSITLMYFPESDPAVTTQPIALFELGQILGELSGEHPRRRLVLAVDPGYPRARDIELLCRAESARLGRRMRVIHQALEPALRAVIAEVDKLLVLAC